MQYQLIPARTERYIPVRQLNGTRTAHYQAVPPIGAVLEPLWILSLGLIFEGDRPSWNTIGVPSSKEVDHKAEKLNLLARVLIDCFRPITTRNRPITIDFNCQAVTVDFDRQRSISGGSAKEGIKKKRETKKREKKNLESDAALHSCDSSPAGDFFSPHREKERGD
ncbi:hypothetical protein B296_00012930, partial [Ensete ventricosum]